MNSNPKVAFGIIFFSDGIIQALKHESIFINNSFRGGDRFLLVKILTRIIEISVLLLFTYFIIFIQVLENDFIQILIHDLILISVLENEI